MEEFNQFEEAGSIEEQVKKKSKKKIILASVLFVLIGALTTFLLILNAPKNVALRAAKNFIGDIVKREEIKPIYKTFKGGSVELSVDKIIEKEDDVTEDILNGDYFSGKIYFGKNKIMIDDFDSKIAGVELKGQLYASADEVYIDEEKIIGEAYGTKFVNFADELKRSIFAPDSGSGYALSQDVFDQIIDAFDDIDNTKDASKDLSKTLKKAIKDVIKIVFDNAEISSEKEKIKLDGNKIKVRTVSITIDADAMSNIIDEVYDYLCTSDVILDYIEEYGDVEAYEELMEDLEDDIDDICDAIDDDDDFDTLEIRISTPKRKAKLLKLEVISGKDTVFELDCGKKGIKKTDSVTIEFDGAEITYQIEEDNRKVFSSFIRIDEGSFEVIISLEIDRKEDSYTITCTSFDEYGDKKYVDKYTIKGDFSKKRDTINMTVDKITTKHSYENSYTTNESVTTYEVNGKIVIDSKDKMPDASKSYKKISDIKESDLDEWIEKVDDIVDMFR